MYLIDKKVFIKQLLPPHWRDTYREAVLSALLAPLFGLYDRLMAYRNAVRSEVNLSGQVLVLDAAVKRIAKTQNAYLVDNNNFSFEVVIPKGVDGEALAEIKKTLNAYKPAGVKYTIIPQ